MNEEQFEAMDLPKLNIYQKLANAKKDMKPIIKDTKAYGYKYGDLKQVIEIIQKPLWNNDLDYIQITINNKIKTSLINLSTGDILELNEFDLMGANVKGANEVQQFGAGITYLRRYALMLAFGLATEDDDAQAITPAINVPQPVNTKPLLDFMATNKVPETIKQRINAMLNTKGLTQAMVELALKKLPDEIKKVSP